ncbi:MAG: 1-(5-phosphoribosyl)-5-[(5-phosphoribosylamino)methylideneamino]imidazole-4-carboxamide isomerase [Clostridia bacterium]
MIIYPSIDILDGKCVRLSQGRYDKVTVYSDDPAGFALKWAFAGARYIHVVDLDGARSGLPVNDSVIRKIAGEAGIPVQAGGGIRTMERIRELVDMGISRVVLGTAAVKKPGFAAEAVSVYGDKIAVGIDARDGFVATDGWESKSGYKAVEFAMEMENAGVGTIIYTDISRDGMMSGPNLDAMHAMVDAIGCAVIASGGVACLEDVIALAGTGVAGVISGKALYEGRLNLFEAQKKLDELTKTEERCLQKE